MSTSSNQEEHEISINRPSIGAIEDINKNQNKFYQIISKYIYSSAKKEDSKVNRIIDIIRSSNVLINDWGQITKGADKYKKILEQIKKEDVSPRTKNKVSQLILQLGYFPLIKEKIIKSNKLNYGDAFEEVSNIYRYPSDKQNIGERMEINCQTFSRRISLCIDNINNVSELKKINFSLMERNNDIFTNIIEFWKYGNANIIRHGDKFIIDSTNDMCASFIANRNENEDIRQRNSKYEYLENKGEPELWGLYQLNGLAENFFKFLPALPNTIENKSIYEEFGNQTLYNIPLKEWLDFLNIILNNGRVFLDITIKAGINNLFLDVKELLGNKLPKSLEECSYELKQAAWICMKKVPESILNDMSRMIRKLTYRRDIMDAPFIFGKVIYLPVCYCLDPVYVISNLMGKTKKWQNKRGYYFEKYIIKTLITNDYAPEEKENTVSDKSHKKEIDIIFEDKNCEYAIVECKTFSNPHSIKYFRYEIDRVRTNLYLKHAKRNYSFFEKEYKDSYRVFLSNIIFPIKEVEEWKKEIPGFKIEVQH